MTDVDSRVIGGGEVGFLPVPAHHVLRVTNTRGGQVVDAWFLDADDEHEHASMSHSRAGLRTIRPTVGSTFVTRRREPIVTLVADTTGGTHDMTMPPCDAYRYAQLGTPDHTSCAGNLASVLRQLGRRADPPFPDPLNLFQNSPVHTDGSITFEPSTAIAGGYVELRAERALVAILSACPMDVMPINGGEPKDVLAQVMPPGERHG
jgi:uncharacterized protein YcgI (DUF1989 family)